MALIDDVAMIAEVDLTKHRDYLKTMIPMLVEKAQDHCNNTFDADKPPAGVKVFIAESIQHKLQSKGVSSRQMGSVSYSYDTDLPDRIMKNLRPYKKVRFK
ncbi:phage head-tail connector protein [Virgibacillus doumboii]|uniref:phage head-tail connector protein n=1 Tax=Virgibacillus doumboii TaxID=2697503 RepID=UPI001FE4E847|nr:phage head-tail connector protein [Virgibacillus doumboii]